MAGWLLCGTGLDDPRAAPRPPVQYLQHRLAPAVRHRPLSRGLPRRVDRAVGVLPGQAGSALGIIARFGVRTRAGGGHLLSIGGLWRLEPRSGHGLRRPADTRSQDRDYSAVTLLRITAGDDTAAPLHRQERRHTRSGGRTVAEFCRQTRGVSWEMNSTT